MNRVGWVDAAKGVGIFFVVVGHTWRGLYNAELDLPQKVFQVVDKAIYAFHMPLFFFCSGLFFLPFIAKSQFSHFLKTRLTRLLWPLALWTWIFFAIKVLAGTAQNDVVTLAEFPLLPLPPILHFWFLWALFVIHIATGLVLYAFRDKLGCRATRFLLLGMALVFLIMSDARPWANEYLGAAYRYSGYFLMGAALGAWSSNLFSKGWAWVMLLGAVLIDLVAVKGFGSNVLSMTIVILLCASISGFDRKDSSENAWFSRLLRTLGVGSLAIYMLHTLFSAGLREILLAVGVTNLPLHLVLGTVVGLWLPLITMLFLKSRNLNRVLGL